MSAPASRVSPSFLNRAANLLVDFDVKDKSSDLSSQIDVRKARQFKSQQHPKNYDKIDADYDEFDMGCSKEPSSRIGADTLDLGNFRTLP